MSRVYFVEKLFSPLLNEALSPLSRWAVWGNGQARNQPHGHLSVEICCNLPTVLGWDRGEKGMKDTDEIFIQKVVS